MRNQNSNRILSTKKQSHNILRESSARNEFGAKDNLLPLNKYKNDIIISPDFFNKRKKYNLLSTINFNIKKSSQNINNPNEFYVSYFKSLLENDKKNAEKFCVTSVDLCSQFRKNIK